MSSQSKSLTNRIVNCQSILEKYINKYIEHNKNNKIVTELIKSYIQNNYQLDCSNVTFDCYLQPNLILCKIKIYKLTSLVCEHFSFIKRTIDINNNERKIYINNKKSDIDLKYLSNNYYLVVADNNINGIFSLLSLCLFDHTSNDLSIV